ncbi:MAG: hypothetical protein PHY30_02915 [Candidatus Pacebacteria bacterium]|nr:hypothetical protein [Candidatus Paceibacterota bacterium]
MNIKLLFGLLIVLFSMLLGGTIYELIDVSEKSYLIGDLEQGNKEIKKEIAGLRVSLSENTALDNFENKILNQGFEQIGKIDYIIVSSNGNIASR